MDVSGLKCWIEDLSAKNKSLENEIETLKNTTSNSLKQTEQDNKSLKILEQENKSLKLLEQENNELKEQQNESLKLLEQKENQLKQQNESLKLLMEENKKCNEDNESLKLKIYELTKGPEVIDVSSESEDEDNNEQSNPRKRRRIDCGELDSDETLECQSERSETPTKLNNRLITQQGSREKQKVGQTGGSSEISQPLDIPLMTVQSVSIFMEFITPRDLGVCRLVCQMWNVEATKQMIMRCTFRLDFCYPGKVKRFLKIAPTIFPGFRHLILDITQLNFLPNQYFHAIFGNHGESLYSVDVEFGCFGLHMGHTFGMYQFHDLFIASLQEIKYLKLGGLPCVLLHEPKMFNHGYNQVLPNLTEINIVLQANCYRAHQYTQVLADLLRIAPNLKTLHWEEKQYVDGHNAYSTKILIESLIQINPPKLEYLFLNSQIQPTDLTLLANSQLKLKRLYFSELNGFKLNFGHPWYTMENKSDSLAWKIFANSRTNEAIPGND